MRSSSQWIEEKMAQSSRSFRQGPGGGHPIPAVNAAPAVDGNATET